MSKRITLTDFELLIITVALKNSIEETGTHTDKSTVIVAGNKVLADLYKKLSSDKEQK